MSRGHLYSVDGMYINQLNKSRKILKKTIVPSIPVIDDSSDDLDEGIGIWDE